MYDTPRNKSIQGALPAIKNVIDEYQKIPYPEWSPELKTLSDLPLVGPLLQQGLLKHQTNYNSFVQGQELNLKQIANSGGQQGFRNMQILDNITGMLPSGYDAPSLANTKFDTLNSYMKANLGVGIDDLYKK